MLYRVTKKFARGPESPIGSYKTIQEAKKVIQEKLADDVAHKVQTTYSLYEGMDLMEEFDHKKLQAISSGAEDQGGSGGGASQQRSQSFSPTPLNMTPAPRGIPRSPFKDSDDKDK